MEVRQRGVVSFLHADGPARAPGDVVEIDLDQSAAMPPQQPARTAREDPLFLREIRSWKGASPGFPAAKAVSNREIPRRSRAILTGNHANPPFLRTSKGGNGEEERFHLPMAAGLFRPELAPDQELQTSCWNEKACGPGKRSLGILRLPRGLSTMGE